MNDPNCGSKIIFATLVGQASAQTPQPEHK
jgi:hypothetical protein